MLLKLETQFLKQRLNNIGAHSDRITILDLACGTGRLSRVLAKDASLFSLDVSFSMLNFHQRNAQENQILIQSNGLRLPFRSNVFHLIVLSMNAIACFSDEQISILFGEIKRVLKMRGIFIMDQLNPAFIEADQDFAEIITDGSFRALERLGPNSIGGVRKINRKYITADAREFNVEESLTFHSMEKILTAMNLNNFHEFKVWNGFTKSLVHNKSSRWVFEAKA